MNIYKPTEFRKRLFELLRGVIKTSEPLVISDPAGDVVLVSKADWENVQETIYLMSSPKMTKKIKEGLDTPLEDCEEVDW